MRTNYFKHVLFGLVALLIHVHGMAQTYLLNESWTTAPTGWTYSNLAAKDWKWLATGGTSNSGSLWSELYFANNYATSPALSLQPGVTYTLRFKVRCNNSTGRKLWAALHTQTSPNGSQSVITYIPVTPTTQTTYTNTFTVPSSGNYYLMYYQMFNGTNQGQYINVYIDDIQVYFTNLPPSVSISSPANNTVALAGTSQTVTASASDADGTISKVEFYHQGSKVGEDATAPYTQNITLAAGTNSVYTVATDNGNATTTSATFTYTGNQAPTVSLTSPANNAVLGVGNVNLTATAADADGSVTSVKFYAGATLVGEDFSSPYSVSWSATSGTYALTAVVTDNNGQTTTSATANVVVNSPPVVSISSPANNTVALAGSALNVTADASDADGTISKVEFYHQGVKVGEDATAPYTQTINLTVGTNSVYAVATDNSNATATSATFTYTGNQAPTVSLTSPADNTIIPVGMLTITASAADADGSVAKVKFYRDTVLIGEDMTAPYSISWSATSGNYSLRAVAVDNTNLETTSGTVNVIVNLPPTITLTVPANNATGIVGNITSRVSASDPDGQIYKVMFYVNGTLAAQDSIAPYQFTRYYAAGSYTVSATVLDDKGFSATSTTNNLTVVAGSNEVLYNENFNSGLNGWYLRNPTSSHNWQYWTDGSGQNGSNCLHNKYIPSGTDYFASPLVTLSATKEYNAVFYARLEKGTTARKLVVAYNSVRDKAGAIALDTLTIPNDGYVQPPFTQFSVPFSPHTDGSYYMVFWALGTGYIHMYVDSSRLETNGIPTVSITSPANMTQINEGSGSITLTATAADADGTISKVEFFADGVKLGEDLSAPYSYTWVNYLPGTRVITAQATDNRGNKSPLATTTLDIRFSDGTITDYAHYSFETSTSAPWTTVSPLATTARAGNGYLGSNTFWLYTNQAGGFMHSPRLYLFAGTTYKFEMRAQGNSVNARTLFFGINNQPSMTGATQVGSVWNVTNTTNFAKNTYTFTVPTDGVYHLLVWSTSTGYIQITVDEMRLIGDMNEAPLVAVTQPVNNLVIAEGTSISMAATASDPDGSVTSVAFKVNGTTVATDNTAPYNGTVSGLSPGNNIITASGFDNRNGEGLSPEITIKVDNNRLGTSSYLGGSGSDDVIRGSAILPDSTVVLAGFIGNSTPGNVAPILLNGSTATTRGGIIRLSPNGQTVLSVTRLANAVTDLSIDSAGNLYVSAGPDGLIKLNPTADAIVWKKTFAKNVYRADAGKTGYAAALTAAGENYDQFALTAVTIEVVDPAGANLSSYGSGCQYTQDVAIHEASQTVITLGTKNFTTQEGSPLGALPVFVPILKGRDFAGNLKYNGYDWDSDSTSLNWLNRPTNNMADVRSSRVIIGQDGKMYITYEVAGGNHVLRYSPFNIMQTVPIVGGDNYFSFANTGAEHKTFIGKYEPATGNYLQGQQFCGRLTSGLGNTVRSELGGVAADKIGRVYITGNAASGLPINLEYLPGGSTSGAFLLVLSPDFATRELCTRLNTNGWGRTVAVLGDKVVFGGSTASSTHFTLSPIQSNLSGTGDGWFAVGNYRQFFKYRPGVHPRLFFSPADLPALRARKTQAPFSNMLATMVSSLNTNDFGTAPIDTNTLYDYCTKAKHLGFLYLIEQNEAYAIEAKYWVNKILTQTANPWASSALKGLTSYYMGTAVAITFDWCANSPNWDDMFKYTVSLKLGQMADMITTNGGTEQSTDQASNWQGSRGASAGLMYLAYDHTRNTTNLATSYGRLLNYLNMNLGSATNSKGWNLEGLGYTYYPWGPMIGPFGIAMARYDAASDIRNNQAVRWMYYTGFAATSNAMDLKDFGGLRPDFTDDNPHITGEGFFGQAFYYGLSEHIRPMRYWYDRVQGTSSPFAARWDKARAGAIWSYLYYPVDSTAVQPMTVSKWREGFNDAQGNGFFTYRNTYNNADDHVAQFRAKLRNSSSAHDGPDGLGFRIIGNGQPWAIGGGRDAPGIRRCQNGLYTSDPATTTATGNRNLSTIVGTPASFTDGSGHIIASMATASMGVTSHKRWFAANYSAATGADAVYVIGDESTNGQFFQLNTYETHSITTSGNTFTITALDGSSLKGTILFPTSNYRYATGLRARGSDYGISVNNNVISFQSDNGDYLVVLTLKKTGSHPSVTYSGTGVTNAVVTVGTLSMTLLTNDITYTSGGRLTSLNTKSVDNLMVYPNPATTGELFVDMPENQVGALNVTLTSLTGQQLMHTTWDSDLGRLRLDVSNLPAGLYLLNLTGHGYSQQVRVTIKH